MKKYSKGSPDAFLAQVENRIEELGGGVIESATDVDTDTTFRDEYEYVQRYMFDILPEMFADCDGAGLAHLSLTDLIKLHKACENLYDVLEKVTGSVEGCESIVASEFDEYDDELSKIQEALMKETLAKLSSEGFDIDDDEVLDYAEGAVELMMNDDDRQNAEACVAYWWKETNANYLYELNSLPKR